MQRWIRVALAACIMVPPAWALEDEMMGTRVNGRMERRDEQWDRVPDPRMDYHDEFEDQPDVATDKQGQPAGAKPKPAPQTAPGVATPPRLR